MTNKSTILIVDDDEWTRMFLMKILPGDTYQSEEVDNGKEAIERLKGGTYDLVITDLRLGSYGGLDVLKFAKAQSYNPEVILVTGYGTIASAVEAIKHGAFEYITKPLDAKRMLLTVERALERKKLKEEVVHLRRQVGERYGLQNIVAESKQMRRIMEVVNMVARTDSTVLIEGESGTGKELIARAIHLLGQRSNKPFIAINCAALPETLLESELFGHVKGAFTGALRDKKGLFEEVNGGTLLLDEIGDMPISLQVKLLRVLQDNEVRRVGSNFTTVVNARIIASTNQKLAHLVKEVRFREDLYYRLNVIPIVIPPLRERKDDIVPLANHFISIYNHKLNKSVKGFTKEALELLVHHVWPGNVRELANLVERAITLSSSELITPSDLHILLPSGEDSRNQETDFEGDLRVERLRERVEGEYVRREKEYIVKALHKHQGNQSRAAQELGISRTSLWSKMKKYDIK